MKTLQEFYNEVTGSDELKKAFVEAMKTNSVKEFLESHGCAATPEEVGEFLAEKAAGDKPLELSPEQLAKVAGGDKLESALSWKCTQPAGESNDCSATCLVNCC